MRQAVRDWCTILAFLFIIGFAIAITGWYCSNEGISVFDSGNSSSTEGTSLWK